MRQNLSLSTLMAKVFAGLVVALLIVGCGPQEIPDTNEESSIGAATEGWIRVVRGVNGGFCSGMAIGNGNDPKVKPTGDLTNLSVSCSKNKQDTVKELSQFLPNPHICYSTLQDLRKARREVVVVRDPIAENPYHCLLGTITPNQFISRSRYQ